MPIQTFGNSSDYLSYPNVKPTLDLNFAATKTLDPRITFTRASTGTYTGLDGLIKTAEVNEPRFDHNPVTRESLGLLVEEQRTNLLLRSEEFDNASWTKVTSTVTANAIAAPNETTTADLVTILDANGSLRRTTSGFSAGATVSFSVFLKKGNTDFALIRISRSGATTYGEFGCYFNLNAGIVSSQSNLGIGVLASSSIQSFPGGWYRCTIVGNVPDATQYMTYVTPTSSSSVAADPGNTLYIWGAQLEVGSFPTSYIPTTSAQVTRSTDVARITGTNFTSWYNPNASTMVNRFIKAETINRFIMGLGYDLSNYAAVGYAGVTNNFAYAQPVISSANSPNDSFTTGSRVTSAFAFDSSGGSVSINGSTPSFKAAVGAMPSGSNGYAVFGASPFGPSTIASGTHQRFIYYPVRLPDSQLRLLTQ